AGAYARPAMNRDMVKPMPVRKAPAAKKDQLRLDARAARPTSTANQLNPKTPTGLPRARPAKIARETGWPRSAPVIATPALAKAKIGMTAKPTHGCSIVSSRSTGESDSVTALLAC